VHVDPEHLEEYPVLHWAALGMTGLLVGVFTFFGLHTLLWAYRSRRERRAAPPEASYTAGGNSSYIQRLSLFQRVMHLVVIVSFLGLAVTGLPLKYSEAPWASWLVGMLGGFRMASALHRLCAVLTFGYFFTHLGHVGYRVLVSRERGLLYGPDSMTPRPQDFRDLYHVFRWFLGKGKKPQFDRWTYWEKFDYLAVFWGMAIIGTSGLVMAFPMFFTLFLPGWVVNLALIIHSDEALLAVGFIFTIHFFNTHLKPEKYPMDTVYYTGRVPLREYERDHPLELERLRASGRLDAVLAAPPTESSVRQARMVGFTAVAIGLGLLALILMAAVFY
jgi:cytochrome b subunit of formate dehydrogenase